jgi:hypothetical protein
MSFGFADMLGLLYLALAIITLGMWNEHKAAYFTASHLSLQHYHSCVCGQYKSDQVLVWVGGLGCI